MSQSPSPDQQATFRLRLKQDDAVPAEARPPDHAAPGRPLRPTLPNPQPIVGAAASGEECFWDFVAEQWDGPDPAWETDPAGARIGRRLVLAYLREVAGSEREAVSQLIELSERDYGSVRSAARRLYRAWRERVRP
jgi:hypothetical protein